VRLAQHVRVVHCLAAALAKRDHAIDRRVLARGLRRAVARPVVEHEHLAGESERRALARDRVEPAQQKLALRGVDDARS